ncbi:helix-turn-helix domain-containing protein [Falsiroseomonas sp.]|uniref:helix-turn-helix domain-containing protein n=1 Tax=Falsiroseomonas sp. TaxID=2870721 RepID=UPI002724D73A|nr:helix-turn-helix domain-containing protein [Falsiroseomonas sp.]MDO9503051.1 helix-turn-helix domain-containing protein [Falsiroseomonas sp.]
MLEKQAGPLPVAHEDREDGVASQNAVACLLKPLRQTTRNLPARLQFDAWRDTNARLVDYVSPEILPESYEVSATTFFFGGLALLAAETPAGTYRRSATNLRRDGIDLLSFSLATHGHRLYRTQDQTHVMRPGQLVLHSLAQPFEAARTRSGWLHLYLTREDLPAAVVPLVSGCQVLDTPSGLLLRDYLLLLADELPRMTVADGQRLADATRAMIALAIAEGPARQEAAAAPLAAVQLARLRNLIRANLGSARLGPMRLCREAGIARSQLYRLFEPLGGVAQFIQGERLNAVYRALTDPDDTRSICEIAAASGLFDASSFSRMFRRAFGISPRELRMTHMLRATHEIPPCNRSVSGSLQYLLQAT